MAQVCKSEDSLGCQYSPSTLLELKSLIFLHSECQASWPPSFQGLFCLCLLSHCRNAVTTDMLPHPILGACQGIQTQVLTLLTEPFPKVVNSGYSPVGAVCVMTVGGTGHLATIAWSLFRKSSSETTENQGGLYHIGTPGTASPSSGTSNRVADLAKCPCNFKRNDFPPEVPTQSHMYKNDGLTSNLHCNCFYF